MRIAVFMGGISSEREVSLRSGAAILESLKNQGYDAYGVDVTEDNLITAFTENEYDLAYIALHGGYGENGTFQGLLDMLNKPYTGSGAMESAVTMDKAYTKAVAKMAGIKVAKTYNSVEEIDGFPVVVKPSRDGSSVGIYFCNNKEEVYNALKELEGKRPLIEEMIQGDELTVGVLNGEGLGVLRIIPKNEFYDYESKYAAGGSVHEYPAKIEKSAYDKAMENAVKIHNIVGLKGISRSDFMLKDGEVYFLEVNTCPGMTKTSLIPDLGTLKGYTFDDLVRIMVDTFRR
ncbi:MULTISPECIES: D-alanine--D-alanine ligase [unclassified Fusobacterium]|uniref:D-alanine--D-alanine ligase n=1 Tax=unclassified Fusobacterium TaxID=2648384 RepID=UPI002622C661|nr:D-alanine--D-alanine ligase [Fusobacterium sp.]